MASRKRPRTMYSADDTDDDSNITLVHEEETTYENSSYKKKVSFSQVTNDNLPQKADPVFLKSYSFHNNLDDEVDDFFSSTVQEINAESVCEVVVPRPEDELGVDSSDDDSTEDEGDLEDDVSSKKPRGRPLDSFRELRTEYVGQLMRRYCPTYVLECSVCGVNGEVIDCLDCFLEQTRCQECFLKEHRHLPLHCAWYFDSGTWRKTTLCELGLVVHLGHNGLSCPASSETRTIVLIDISGVHEVEVSYCSCERLFGVDATERCQLINHGWFPATTDHPGTVATFTALDTFVALSGEGKLSGYHFYKSIVRLKDGAGYENIPRRYEEFMRMTREYQHLKMLLRAGKTTDPDMPLTVGDGELAINCPACPHPGQNIPADWEKKVDSYKKKTAVNPDLGDGNSYFVREEPYMLHLGKTIDEKEIKYCDSRLHAVDHANLKGGNGYISSGVVGVQCRHMLIRPNGVGDLQKGEKYANVDYVVLSSLKDLQLRRLIMSYDIACQYCRNFRKRMLKLDDSLQLNLHKLDIGFVIPQFHVAGHGDSCRTRFNLRFREHVGRTDGENIERGWAALNPLSMASKEMGSGSRHDYLDWHIGDWNYQRVVSFGRIFLRKLIEAVAESLKHSQVLVDFRTTFPKAIVKEIEDAIKKWDEDPSNAYDPYSEISRSKAMLKTQNKLTHSEMQQEVASVYSDAASETRWLVAGLELEDTQRCNKRSYKELKSDKVSSTSTIASEKNAQALRKIHAWKSEQILHMPRVSKLPEWSPIPEKGKGSLRCWKIKLLLPSHMTSTQRLFACSDSLIRKEFELRIAQAHDSLVELRHLLQKEWWLRNKKRKHVSGQKLSTKSNCAIDVVVEQRVDEVARYRGARAALVALEPTGHWQRGLKVLRDEDIRHFEDDEGKGEGRRSPSWIWTVKGAADIRYDEDTNAYEGLKVEYAKARARAFRWYEEVQLIKEEMRRVICYFNWKIGWWLERNYQLKNRTDEAALGSIVYGNRQIVILQNLGNKFRCKWLSDCDLDDLPEIRSDSVTFVKSVARTPRLRSDIPVM